MHRAMVILDSSKHQGEKYGGSRSSQIRPESAFHVKVWLEQLGVYTTHV